ncbi:hypothetical protein [Dehalogenimonas alkenigignens]|uniref:Uncharacterized protein n=1 Tax=Dehalogenimonas alkenigignens TaxID=1217799 RepID=A0A0W0GGV8_9CHLR|nr:hypothetical protein [Dehalogenimonas alkenigignens]KTB47771.1 hypothetical protein DEALK_06160 [Dehalogenimonas alkenigignens]PVV83970.1 hypothetical protein DD509_04655 [Dehalogenimonas alkenigignens]
MKARLFTLAVCFLLLLTVATGCAGTPEKRFQIILTDTGETVLSESDIAAYLGDGTLELNQRGIDKWNSFLTHRDIPELAKTLHNREFVIKINDKEICHGKFWSMVSSASVNGVVILDSLLKLDAQNDTLQILSTYPARDPLQPAIGAALEEFFK